MSFYPRLLPETKMTKSENQKCARWSLGPRRGLCVPRGTRCAVSGHSEDGSGCDGRDWNLHGVPRGIKSAKRFLRLLLNRHVCRANLLLQTGGAAPVGPFPSVLGVCPHGLKKPGGMYHLSSSQMRSRTFPRHSGTILKGDEELTRRK